MSPCGMEMAGEAGVSGWACAILIFKPTRTPRCFKCDRYPVKIVQYRGDLPSFQGCCVPMPRDIRVFLDEEATGAKGSCAHTRLALPANNFLHSQQFLAISSPWPQLSPVRLGGFLPARLATVRPQGSSMGLKGSAFPSPSSSIVVRAEQQRRRHAIT
jgi:hypothetical protein